MTESDVLFFISGLFGCWFAGWASAFLFKSVKQFLEKL